MVRVRLEPSLKKHAESIFDHLGITASQAITMFYKQVEIRKGLPFQVVIPNKTTIKTFSSTDAGKDLMICTDAQDMYSKLGI